ncbi:MAG: orotidine-5'-phosphate decarboxylase [Burkholderiales bacterium]
MKDIPRQERLIFALDVPNAREAKRYVELLGDSVSFYKIGLQLFTSSGYFELLEWLLKKDKKVFADLKLFDVPETVRLAVRNLSASGAQFVTVHAGNHSILEAACAEKGELKILAVTVLTSLDQGDLRNLGFQSSVEEIVMSRAKSAREMSCDGVIASAREARPLREELGEDFLIVCPGIRLEGKNDDQKRTTGVAEAFESGADYIVVGRPIRDASDPRLAAEEIHRQIATAFE